MKVKNMIRLAGMLCLCVFILATRVHESRASQTELTKIKLGGATGGAGNYQLSLWKELKLDHKYGFDAELILLGFRQLAEAVRLGQVGIGMVQPATALKMTHKGTPVKITVPCLRSGNSFLVRKDSPYKTLTDLKGKKIGNFSRVTGAYFLSAVLAKLSGFDIEKDFDQFLGMTGALIGVFEKGEVEAINMFDPISTKLLVTGKYRKLLDFDTEYEKLMGSSPLKASYGAHINWLRDSKNAEIAKNFSKGLLESAQYIRDRKDKDFFYKNASKIFGLKTQKQIDGVWEINHKIYFTNGS